MFEKDTGTNNDFGIPSSTSTFSEYYARLPKEKVEKIKKPLQRDSAKVFGIGQGANRIDRLVIIYSSSSFSSPSSMKGFPATEN